ncbi:MAG: superoxide dismutase [Ni] [Thermodesulfobacteriota bacterium]|nr:superoxide dismutase [Ni] [Thermodesulfobacteriota bacterium]
MRKTYLHALVIFSFLFVFLAKASAHCEIPCGIYDDEMRINMMNEHIDTIEKSINQIMRIEEEKQKNFNQLIRWVVNKERHANALQNIVSQYFMTQRIKPEKRAYEKKLSILHQILIYSMKCKQTTDRKNIEKLRGLLKDFQILYFNKK